MRIAGIVGALSAGRIIATFGERRTFIAMPAVIFGSYILLAAWDVPAAQIAFLTMNFVVVLSQPTVTDYLNRRVESERRATVISLTNIVRSVVLIAATPMLGQIAESSLQAAFLVGGIIVAAMGLPLMLAWLPHLLRSERLEHVEPLAVPEPAGVIGADPHGPDP